MTKVKVIVAVAALALWGCTSYHDVVKEYPQYLINNQGASHLPTTSAASNYTMTPATQTHHYEFRSRQAGGRNVWVVEFGRLLEHTLESRDVQGAFGRLTRAGANDPRADLLVFDLQRYEFVDMGAHVALKVSHVRQGVEVFTRIYQADGDTQGGKMFWGGAYAMQNAVHQSTKHAVDEILRRLIADLNAPGRAAARNP
ncbi:MAG TPA: hypothetical protein VK601_02015 [Kofleriaceae bacterium]|nr:hypothetical protein [Kofleriaceae bacterium]